MVRGPSGGARDVTGAASRDRADDDATPEGYAAGDARDPAYTVSSSADELELVEVERVLEEVQRWVSGDPDRAGEPPARSSLPRVARLPEEIGPRGERNSGFFEHNLTATRRELVDMDREIRELEASAETLRGRTRRLGRGLDRLTREYAYVRARGAPGPDGAIFPGGQALVHVAPAPPGPPPWDEESVDGPARDPPAVYEQFTVDRYNRTMGELHGRRSKLILWTLGLSAVVGSLLLALALYSPHTNPPLWIAVLPLVWVVPIPFFLLSFRGTHRMLEGDRLLLPGVE